MSDQDKRTQRTEKGHEIPVPKRGEFFRNLRKVVRPSAGERRERGHGDERPKP